MSEGNVTPVGWGCVPLGNIVLLINGDRGKNYPSRDAFVENGVPFINAGHLDKGRIEMTAMNFISEERFGMLQSGKVKEGDVLFCLRGSLGKAAIVRGFRQAAIASSLVIARPSEAIASEYLLYYFLSPLANRMIVKYDNGTAQPNLAAADLKKFLVPIASLAEQRRIIAKVEELFSDLDAGVAALERVRANLKRYRASVLKAAVEGRLTEKWRNENPSVEPASKLLQRILAERRKKWEKQQLAKFAEAGKSPPKNWQDKYEEPAAPDISDLPDLPKGWCWATVEQLSIVVRGGSPRPAGDSRYFGGGHTPWITVGDLTADDTVHLYSVPESLTAAGRERSRFIESDTLLLTNSGATLGVPKIIMIGGCINDGSVALLALDYPLKLYLYYFLKSQTERLRAINQGAAQPNLNTGIVKAIIVPLPPQPEQTQINRELEQRLSIQRETEHETRVWMKRTERLRQSILKRAFEGKLVPQDPKDEPASVLLQRITSARQTNDTSKAPTRKIRNTRAKGAVR